MHVKKPAKRARAKSRGNKGKRGRNDDSTPTSKPDPRRTQPKRAAVTASSWGGSGNSDSSEEEQGQQEEEEQEEAPELVSGVTWRCQECVRDRMAEQHDTDHPKHNLIYWLVAKLEVAVKVCGLTAEGGKEASEEMDTEDDAEVDTEDNAERAETRIQGQVDGMRKRLACILRNYETVWTRDQCFHG